MLGLTGSIAMGKSTAAADLPRARRAGVRCRCRGAPPAGAGRRRRSREVSAAFPGLRAAAAADRPRARSAGVVFGDPAALARLEAILHPLVRAAERRFLARCAARAPAAGGARHPAAVRDRRASAWWMRSRWSARRRFVQAQRVLAGAGMTPERLAAIRARQMPDGEKRRRADFVIPTGLDRRQAVGRSRRSSIGCVGPRPVGQRLGRARGTYNRTACG